tara:strand:- start:242 stop:352 length:111 start_codon:yes stop_codon:yes gene_type:complete
MEGANTKVYVGAAKLVPKIVVRIVLRHLYVARDVAV